MVANTATDAMPGNDAASGINTEAQSGSETIIKNGVIASMAVGLVPVPVVDLVLIAGINVQMMRKISEAYDTDFNSEIARSAVMSLLAGGVPAALGVSASSLLKTIPGLGTISGASGVVILAGASTYAIGRLYAEHLDSGGTLLSFRSLNLSGRFKAMLDEGRAYATALRERRAATRAAATQEPAPAEPAHAADGAATDAAGSPDGAGPAPVDAGIRTTRTASVKPSTSSKSDAPDS